MAKERVRDVMSMGVTTLPADRTVTAAARLMEAENVGDVIVTENNGIRGVVTDRDITVRAVAPRTRSERNVPGRDLHR